MHMATVGVKGLIFDSEHSITPVDIIVQYTDESSSLKLCCQVLYDSTTDTHTTGTFAYYLCN